MQPDGFVLQPAWGECTRTSNLVRTFCKRCIDLIHIKLLVIHIRSLYLLVKCFLRRMCLWQLQVTDRSLQEQRDINDLQILRRDHTVLLCVIRHAICHICRCNAILHRTAKFDAFFHICDHAVKNCHKCCSRNRLFFSINAKCSLLTVCFLRDIHSIPYCQTVTALCISLQCCICLIDQPGKLCRNVYRTVKLRKFLTQEQ